MVLAATRNTTRHDGAAVPTTYEPVCATDVFWSGGMACLNTAGLAVPANSVTGCSAVIGRIERTVDNSAGATPTVALLPGQFKYTNSGTSITSADVGSPCYAVDDESVHISNAGGRPLAGIITRVDTDGVIFQTLFHAAQLASLAAAGGLASGPVFYTRGASTANIANLATAAITIDGVTYVEGERILLKDQTAPAENGVYIYGTIGATAPLTRAPEMDDAAELVPNLIVRVSEGTLGLDSEWTTTTNATIVVGTTATVWVDSAYIYGLVGAMAAEAIGSAAAAGTANEAARIDHVHAMPASAVPTGAVAIAAGAEGTDATIARTDHQHPCASAAPTGAVIIAAAGTEGTDTTLARTDHAHPCASVAPTGAVAIAAGAEGTDTTLARTDHQHPCASAAPTGAVAIAAGAEGAAVTLARTDHQHPCASVAPTGAVAVAAGAEGAETTLARTDHQHPCASAAPTGAVAIAAGAEGAAVTLARTDHQHPCASAAPGETGELNAEGAAVTLARTDHVHAEHSHEVRYVMTADVPNLAAFVVTQDGVVGVEGDLVLLANQTVPAESGVYQLGAVVGTAPLTRVAWLPADAIVQGGYTVRVNEGTLFQDTSWFIAEAGAITIGTVAHTWYPETVTTVATLAAGTVTIATIPILSATHTGFAICRESANTSNATTGGYHPTVGGANAVTAGVVGTGTFTIEATVAAGTINNADISDLYVTVINR